MPRGRFIVLEGPDKSGKSSQAARLAGCLRARGLDVVHTREPGGTAFSERIRDILLSPDYSVRPIAELLLYEAARAQHTEEVLRPALRRGAVVVCERYTLATLAYQGLGRGIPLARVRALNRIATSGLSPDLTIVLDASECRLKERDPDRKLDRLETAGAAFHRRVRNGYRALARSEGAALISTNRDMDAVASDILARVDKVLA
jgi:dTMP kinase